ncbi:MAG TPA: ATP-binding protein [Rhodothermia bacterium]|nr:ATP-binding protein [Rhodothermia bacterium]
MTDSVNPFRYGGVVGPEDFCNRAQEIRDLKKSIANSDRLFLYSERRMGKTSLIRRVLSGLSKRSYLAVYVDLWPTDDASSFAQALAKALSEAGATRAEKAFETAKSLFAHLKPALTLDQAGNPSLQFGAETYTIPEPDLADVLQAPQRLAERRRNRKVAVVFDEFQRILEYPDDQVERMLRAAIQEHRQVAYLFLGSRKHLIQTMFLDANRPLYRSATHYPLKAIAAEDWMGFISERFASTERRIRPEIVKSLIGLSEGHPFYTQHLAHALWELTPPGEESTAGRLDQALTVLLERESYAYSTLWDTLTSNQQRLLRGLAEIGSEPPPFSGEFAQRFGLSTPANAQSASRGLLAKDIVDRENGSLVIVDRFFRL